MQKSILKSETKNQQKSRKGSNMILSGDGQGMPEGLARIEGIRNLIVEGNSSGAFVKYFTHTKPFSRAKNDGSMLHDYQQNQTKQKQ